MLRKKVIPPRLSFREYDSCRLNVLPPMTLPDEKWIFENTAHVLLVVGETGVGKTSLIDTFTNYVHGVKFEDDIRYTSKSEEELKENQTKSQTKGITVTIMDNAEMTLGVIDTPGFGDTDDDDIDIPGKLKQLLDKQKPYPKINGICFVVKGTANRLGKHEEKIFNQVLEMFPKEAKTSTFACFTHCSDCKVPPNASNAFSDGIHANKDSKLHKEFAFDNSKIMYGTKFHDVADEDDPIFEKMMFDRNMKTCANFFKATRATCLDSEGISIIINNRREAEVIQASILASMAKTCQEIVDLHSEKEKIETGENRLVGKHDVHCRECKNKCCSLCVYPGVDRCDKMKVSKEKVANNRDGMPDGSGKGIGLVGAAGVGGAAICGAIGATVATGGAAAVVGGAVVGTVALISFVGWLIYKDSDIYVCKECDHGSNHHEFKDPVSHLPSSQEISEKIETTLKTKKDEMHKTTKQFKQVLDDIQEQGWVQGQLTVESFVKKISDIVTQKCPENTNARMHCKNFLRESMKKVFGSKAVPYM